MSQKISAQVQGLKGLEANLKDIAVYLQDVAKGELPVNHHIVYLLQVCCVFLQSVQHFCA